MSVTAISLLILCSTHIAMANDQSLISWKYFGYDNNRILAVDGTTMYVETWSHILMYDVESKHAVRTQRCARETGDLSVVHDYIYGVSGDTLRRFSRDLVDRSFDYVHHEGILGVAGEQDGSVIVVSTTGLHLVDLQSREHLRHIVVDSIQRYERRNGTGFIFTADNTLVLLNEATLDFETVGTTIPVDSATFVAISDSLLCLGIPSSSHFNDNVLEYWDLTNLQKMDVEFASKGMPLAAVGTTVLKTPSNPSPSGIATRLVQLCHLHDNTEESIDISVEDPLHYSMTASAAASIGNALYVVGEYSLIAEVDQDRHEMVYHSLLGNSGRIIRFHNELEGFATSWSYGLSTTVDGGRTWQPWTLGVEIEKPHTQNAIVDVKVNSEGQTIAYTMDRILVADTAMLISEVHMEELGFYVPTLEMPQGYFLRCDTSELETCSVYAAVDGVEFALALELPLEENERGLAVFIQGDSTIVYTENQTSTPFSYYRKSFVSGEPVASTYIARGNNFHLVQKRNDQFAFSIFNGTNGSWVGHEDLVSSEFAVKHIPVDSVYVLELTVSDTAWTLLDCASGDFRNEDGINLITRNLHSAVTEVQRYRGIWIEYCAQILNDTTVIFATKGGPIWVHRSSFEHVVTDIDSEEIPIRPGIGYTVTPGDGSLVVSVAHPTNTSVTSVSLFSLDGRTIEGQTNVLPVSETSTTVDVKTTAMANGRFYIGITTDRGSSLIVPVVVEN